jgi:hypothetical protein
VHRLIKGMSKCELKKITEIDTNGMSKCVHWLINGMSKLWAQKK